MTIHSEAKEVEVMTAVLSLCQAAKRIIVSTSMIETEVYLPDDFQFALTKALSVVEQQVLGSKVKLEKCVCCEESLDDPITAARGFCDDCSDDDI